MEGLIDTRNEYIEHIQDVIAIPLSQRIYDIWCDSKLFQLIPICLQLYIKNMNPI